MAPNCDYERIAPLLDAAAKEFDITTPKQIRHFIAHLCVESSHFSRLTENLNYSAKRLCQVWPNRFPSAKEATPYANNPQALANHIYSGRMGNVNPGDGYAYRGRGYIQLTGRYNYNVCGQALGLDLIGNPDLAATPAVAARVAGWYWKVKNLNGIITNEKDEFDMTLETRAINGGLIGLADREMELHKASLIWKD